MRETLKYFRGNVGLVSFDDSFCPVNMDGSLNDQNTNPIEEDALQVQWNLLSVAIPLVLVFPGGTLLARRMSNEATPNEGDQKSHTDDGPYHGENGVPLLRIGSAIGITTNKGR